MSKLNYLLFVDVFLLIVLYTFYFIWLDSCLMMQYLMRLVCKTSANWMSWDSNPCHSKWLVYIFSCWFHLLNQISYLRLHVIMRYWMSSMKSFLAWKVGWNKMTQLQREFLSRTSKRNRDEWKKERERKNERESLCVWLLGC
jgi:hypothetical protein